MENKQKIKPFIQWLIIGIFSSTASHVLIELLQNIGFTTNYLPLPLFLLGTTIMFMIYLLFSSLFGSSIIGSILQIVAAIIIGIITRVKHYYRAEPLYPHDFAQAKEVPFLIEMVGWPIFLLIVGTIISAIILLYLFYKHKVKPKQADIPKKFRWGARLLGVLIAISSLLYISQFHAENNHISQIYNRYTSGGHGKQIENYAENGFVAGFLSNLSAEPIEQPENYSKEAIKQIADKYREKAVQINQRKDEPKLDTNVLFVMNESFSDPFKLKGIESNKDPIPYYRERIKETLSGYVLSPTFGGGTDANEFQVLTGFSLEPLNRPFTSPYMQLEEEMEDIPTLVKKMNDLNYQTTAIHPYDPQFFKRDEVYAQMNFEDFLHQDNMNNREKVSDEHFYISDASVYKEALEVMEASKETDFIHMVTMQNHTPYADKYDEVDYEVTGSGNEEEANAYFQDLNHSDQALKSLIEKMDDHDEPILLVFWGDHLPGLYRGNIRETNSEVTLRQTPFLIYSNTFDIEGEEKTMSPIYLHQYVFDLLNIEVSPYEALLMDLEEQLPIIDKGLYYEKNTDHFHHLREELTEESLEVLEDYTLFLYDVISGNQYADEYNFFE